MRRFAGWLVAAAVLAAMAAVVLTDTKPRIGRGAPVLREREARDDHARDAAPDTAIGAGEASGVMTPLSSER